MKDSFKDYTVRYNLMVNAEQIGAFDEIGKVGEKLKKVTDIARNSLKPLGDFRKHFGKIWKTANEFSKKGSFEINPSINMAGFSSQCETMIAEAEKTAAKVSEILSRGFTIAPPKTGKDNKKQTKGGSSSAKQEVFTKERLESLVAKGKEDLDKKFGKAAALGPNAKRYKEFLKSQTGAALEELKKLRIPYERDLKDLARAKRGKEVVRQVTNSTTKAIEESGKKIKGSKATSVFDNIIKGMATGVSVPVPITVISDAKSLATLNTAIGSLRSKVEPIVIPITVATNIESAKAVRQTVQGLQNVISGKPADNGVISSITPSSTGTKPKQSGTKPPVVKTERQKALEKQLGVLNEEKAKYEAWKKKHDDWQKIVNNAKKAGANAPISDAQMDKALEKVLYTDKGKKRIVPIEKPKLKSLSEKEKLEQRNLKGVFDPLLKQKEQYEKELRGLKTSAGKRALVGKQFERAKELKETLIPQITKQIEETKGWNRYNELNKKEAQIIKDNKEANRTYKEWLQMGGPSKYTEQIEKENKALNSPVIRNKILKTAREMTGQSKLPQEPKLPVGVRTLEQINPLIEAANKELEGIVGTAPTSKTKKTAEEKNLEKRLRQLKSEKNKRAFYDEKLAQWKKKVDEIKNSSPEKKLPPKPKLAEGIRTVKEIEGERATVEKRLEEIRGAAPIPPQASKGKSSGKVGKKGGKIQTPSATSGVNIPLSQLTQPQATGAQVQPITANVIPNFIGGVGKNGAKPIPPIKVDVIPNFIGGTGKNGMKPIPPIKADVIPNFMGGAGKNGVKPIAPIKVDVIPNFVSAAKGAGKKTATPITMPVEGVIENAVVSSGVKVSGGPIKVEGIVDKVGLSKGAAVTIPDVTRQVASLKELSTVWKNLPKTGRRTYTVNVKTPGIENLPKLKELAALMSNMPQSQRRVYSGGIGNGKGGNGGAGGNGRSTNMYLGGGSNTSSRFIGRPRGTMNTFAYQLMGNTSLGARTPVFLDMMKGMGMMSGVGAAMSTLTEAFTNASEYQNTMVTAKSILEANYQGGNFDSDFGGMTKIVRDVAKRTKFTAPQAADAARFMAMAGLNIPMINASIRPIADVAVIGDNDLGEVADKITNIQTAFGIQPNKMRALADALTKTFTSSNTDMMMLAESMEYAAPMAHLAGAQVEDALAMIGIMGNAGIQGSMAGTTLRMMYQNVINPNKKQSKMWESLGISLRDAQGNPRQLMDILGDLRQKVRISKEDKDEEGKFKDEGTPIAEAVSKLFRVTASAGAGTLIENLDKVIALAEANRNSAGLSQRISEVKQNDIKGMWAKMTSAFTDAVVTEFESNESPIKGYIESLTKYFNSPDFKDVLHDLFDLVTSMMNTLGNFAKIWKDIYDTCGGLVKYVLMAQFWMTQIGYLLAPLRSVWMTISRGYGAAVGAMGSMGTVGAMGSAGVAAAGMGAMPFIPSGKGGKYNTAAINAARNAAMGYDYTLVRNKKYLAAATALNASTSPAIQRAIERKQMQWFVASNLVGNAASLRSSDNRAARWSLAYTNPQAASELPNRFKIMSNREREIAALQRQLAMRNSNLAAAESAVILNSLNSRYAHQELNKQIGKVRHKYRMASPEALARLHRAGKIGGLRALGMSASSGFRSTVTWGVTGVGLAQAASTLTNVTNMVSKAFGFLLNPITLAVAAFVGLGIAAWNAREKVKKVNEGLQNEAKAFGEKVKASVDELNKGDLSKIFTGIKTVSINSAIVNIENEDKKAGIISADEEYNKFYNIVKDNYRAIEDGQRAGQYFLGGNIQDSSIDEWYNSFVKPMVGLIPNLPQTLDEFKNRNGGGGFSRALTAVDVVKSIHGNKGVEEALKIKSEIEGMYSELLGLDDKKRKELTPQYLEQIKRLTEKLNPIYANTAKLVTPNNIVSMLDALPTEDIAYYQAGYSAIQKYLNDSGIINAIKAYSTMKDNAPALDNKNEWGKIIWDMAKTMPVNFVNKRGELIPVNLPFDDNGVLRTDKLDRIAADKDVYMANHEAHYVKSLGEIYRQMINNIPGLKESMKAIGFTEEAFVKHAMNYGSNDNSLANKAVEQVYGLSSYIDKQSPKDQLPYKPWGTDWAKITSQEDYMSNKKAVSNQNSQKPLVIYMNNNFDIKPTMKEEIDTEKLGETLGSYFSNYMNNMMNGSNGYRWY